MKLVPLTHAAYSFESRYLRGMLRARPVGSAGFGAGAAMRYAAIYVIGWGCA